MEIIIRDIGNSKGIILPQSLIKKYHFFKKVILSETPQGIIISSAETKSLFEQKLEKLKANKKNIYALMSKQAEDAETIAYYEQQAEEIGNIDLEILD